MERGREGKNHNGLSTNITRSSFCGGGQKREEETEEDGSLSLELPDENSRRDGIRVKKQATFIKFVGST